MCCIFDKISAMDYRKFYNELGKLLYAVAIVDGKVQQKEIEEVKKIVREELLHLEDTIDDFNTDAAFFAEFEFDYMRAENTTSADELLKSFADYLNNTPQMRPSVKRAVSRAARRVAESFAGINKKEKALLEKIDGLLA